MKLAVFVVLALHVTVHSATVAHDFRLKAEATQLPGYTQLPGDRQLLRNAHLPRNVHLPRDAQLPRDDHRLSRGFHLQVEEQRMPQVPDGNRASGRLREESVQSAALGRAMKYRVLLPDRYDSSLQRYPVLYLLHGLNGSHTDWTTRTNLSEYSRAFPLIIVMPEANNAWYTNSSEGAYEDYILTDLAADVVGKFRTINSRYGRAVAGLSMGGYGALKMALKRPAAFAVAGSFSGAFNVTKAGELEKLVGETEARRMEKIFGPADSQARKENDILALASRIKPAGAPYFYIDCGTGDNGLIDAGRALVTTLHKAGVAYEYHEVAGAHSWDYWDRRVREFLPILMRKLQNE